MQGRPVAAARLGKPAAQGEMEGAADLLVEQDVLARPPDPVIQAERELTQAAGARIRRQHGLQVVPVFLCLRRHHPAAAEFKLHPVHFAAAMAGGKGKGYMTLRAVLERRSEHLAARHVAVTAAVDEFPPVHAQPQVGIRRLDAYFPRPAQLPQDLFLPRAQGPPRRDRIAPVEEQRARDELRETGQTHLRVLRVGGGRVEGQDPAVFPVDQVAHRLAGAGQGGELLRGHAGQRPGIAAGHDADLAVRGSRIEPRKG